MPVPGDEDYVGSDFTICREPNAPPVQSLSAMMRAQSISFATPSGPSLYTSTNPARSGASLSTASAAAPQFRLISLLSSAPAALPSLRTAAPTLLSGIPALSFAAATVPSLCPPLQNLNANEVLPNFSANPTLGVNLPAQAVHHTYNVMAVASQDLTKLTLDPSRTRIKQIIANLRSSINTYRIEEVVPFNLRNYLKMKFASLYPNSKEERALCAHFLTWDKHVFCLMLDQAFPETGHYSQGAQTSVEKISQFSLCFDLGKESVEQATTCKEQPQHYL